MAYKKRKELVESQIKEHNLAKVKEKSDAKASKDKSLNKCPMSVDESASQIEHQEPQEPKPTESTSGELKKPDGKKVVVSIQSNEEKNKENTMSNLKKCLNKCPVGCLILLFL